jgi:pimeloyl-ACP methyl ester carboxylesterase
MNLYFKETGKTNSKTIIFLHAEGLSGWMWNEQLKSFKDYHCIVPDLPEHGKSKELKPFAIKGTAKFIVDIIYEYAHNQKAHIVGISLGAQIVLQILNIASEVVDHAFISGTLIRSIPNDEKLLKVLDHAIKVYKPVKNTNFFIKANMRTYNIPKNLFNDFKESTKQIEDESLKRILSENMIFKLPNGLEKVKVPVIIVIGEKDYKIIKESAKDLIEILPNSKGAIACKVGHLWNLESPKLFNQLLRAWINNKNLTCNDIIFI